MITKKIYWSFVFTIVVWNLDAQVAIGTSSQYSSAQLEMRSTDKGLLLPRMTASLGLNYSTHFR